ncbi:MAG: stage II sporulation protein R [Firmicutes bacterium]|nr:stage II sporulation protein R [Bacillota bacterium]MDD4263099.1 stage II sporulation protein R [Bacillota bacterium]MDD4693428.1 stage II sporulation protein R [Bacillota bacterium]
MRKRVWGERLEKLGLIFMAICLIPLFLGTTDGSQEFLRLHVLANSDSLEDQMLKLKARDAILNEMNTWLSGEKDLESVIEIVRENEGALVQKVAEAIDKRYDVKIELGREKYPEKDYGNLTLPNGEYLSLRVIIGKGDGQNWWCVLFPLLCSIEAGENAIEVVDGSGGPPVRFRFKLAQNDRPKPPSLDTVLAFLQQFRLWPWS